MNYTYHVFCDSHATHVLQMDDAVIQNWAAAMWEDGCKAMVMAVPQMMAAVLEWRANWLGDISLKQVEERFQEIHDFWTGNLAEPEQHPYSGEGIDRLPGDWLRFHPVKPGSQLYSSDTHSA